MIFEFMRQSLTPGITWQSQVTRLIILASKGWGHGQQETGAVLDLWTEVWIGALRPPIQGTELFEGGWAPGTHSPSNNSGSWVLYSPSLL